MGVFVKLDFGRLAALTAWHCCALTAAPLFAADDEFSRSAAPLFKQFCYECHAGQEPEAGLNLERMAVERSFAADFKHWRNVAALVAEKKMPPADMPQPSDEQRKTLASLVRGAVSQAAAKDAGDPGPVVIRRLTSAEYAYTIRDLTGLDLKLDRDFVSDAVGGEGFTNIGTVQFLQDSTLERYLAAARQVASHAVIGAGPLDFFRDPGKTGHELWAINRIQEIYRQHGIRTAAGEGAIPFGLDRYPKAFFAAWRYKHRERLGLGDIALEKLASDEGQSPRFAQHVWSVVTAAAPSFPASEIVARWKQLPVPDGADEQLVQKVRAECDELYRYLIDWQTRLARSIGDEEEAAVLSEESLNVVKSKSFTARFFWPEGATTTRVQFSVMSADPNAKTNPVVIWRNPRLRFRTFSRRREEPPPLKTVLTEQAAAEFEFGVHPRGGEIGANDFVTVGAVSKPFELTIPAGARGIDLLVDAELDFARGDDGVVRSELTGIGLDGTPRTVSALLANPIGAALQSWKAGVLDLARLLPQVSHREPAPSDRDPIPAPFDNTYNMRERDYFHYKVKYHRDDKFLVEKLLDEGTRRRLDEGWADLLGSFEYHDAWLRFLAEKFELESLRGKSIADVDLGLIDQIPAEPRTFVKRLRDDYDATQRSRAAGELRHVDDTLQFATRTWRRPLRAAEPQRLRAFYSNLRASEQLTHSDAIRALLVRVLVAPEFLYRAERPAESTVATPLSDYELASRLSYFLWSSLPDEELARAAAAGELRESEQLAQQARRMLADPKARRLATEFFGQWFGFYQFDRYRGVDPQRFPEFTDQLKTALHEESIAFFEHIIRADRPASEILFADYAFLNADTAKHYGISSEVAAATPRKVENLADAHRGGLLGLGAVLTVTSAPLRTSPVKRGDWVLRRVLGTAVPPPPADAGSIPADDVLGDGKTVRARLEAHRHNATCANCHARIDPFGFALEHYDALGRWRERYKDGEPIDASGTLSDGTTISGTDGLRQYLKDNQPRFHRTLSLKLLGYALGRGELVSDEKLIEEMLASLSGDGRFSELVVKIATSRQFRYHRGQELAQAPAAAEGP